MTWSIALTVIVALVVLVWFVGEIPEYRTDKIRGGKNAFMESAGKLARGEPTKEEVEREAEIDELLTREL